jgi:hypothetical protein
MLKHLVYILTTWDRSVSGGNISATLYNNAVDSSGRVEGGVRLLLLDYWDRGFESRRKLRCSSVVLMVCCVGSDICDELIIRPEESYQSCLCVSLCDL